MRLFADDTIAYLVIKLNSDVLTLQRDLDKLAQWKQLWKMAFHPDKCNVLTISPDVVDVAFPFEVLADCYSQIFCLINRFQDMTVKAIIEFYRCFIT
jgi:hypothetical protein